MLLAGVRVTVAESGNSSVYKRVLQKQQTSIRKAKLPDNLEIPVVISHNPPVWQYWGPESSQF